MMKKFLNWTILPVILLTLISCNALTIAIPNGLSLNNITEQEINETISLRGKVINTAPFLQGGAYQIEDNTGKIWVITEESLPKEGEEIRLKATIKQENIILGPQNFPEYYLEEISLIPVLNNNSIQQLFFPHK